MVAQVSIGEAPPRVKRREPPTLDIVPTFPVCSFMAGPLATVADPHATTGWSVHHMRSLRTRPAATARQSTSCLRQPNTQRHHHHHN
jgi:hypothetical protein